MKLKTTLFLSALLISILPACSQNSGVSGILKKATPVHNFSAKVATTTSSNIITSVDTDNIEDGKQDNVEDEKDTDTETNDDTAIVKK